MIRFNNDYSRGAHPKVIEAISSINNESYAGYGLDYWCGLAEKEIKELIKKPGSSVHFMTGGTQANLTVISALLRPWESVICPGTGHINVHETGSIEHIGHKIEALPPVLGKITAGQIREAAEGFKQSGLKEHVTKPALVYISFPTEYGTIYSREELAAISRTCREYGLILFVDGARLGYGLAAEGGDVTLEDMAEFADVFYIGGTKCGALFGEALIFTDCRLSEYFRNSMKQNGGMLAKGWLLGVQFHALLKDGLYFDITAGAVRKALAIKQAFRDAGIPLYMDSPTNQQFVLLTEGQLEALSKKYIYEFQHREANGLVCVRFCTAWYTTDDEVNELMADIASFKM